MLPHAGVNSSELDSIPWQPQRPLQDQSTLSVSETSLLYLRARTHMWFILFFTGHLNYFYGNEFIATYSFKPVPDNILLT